jgi:adenylyl-sulfate kinase
MDTSKNLFPHKHFVDANLRRKLINQNPILIWLSGLSGSGKSTIANDLEKKLYENGFLSYLLDGDNIRIGLNKDLGFSDDDRKENIRRISEVSRLMLDAGLIVITAFISPFEEERDLAKSLVKKENYFLVHVDCSVEKCEERDVKGLYKKARMGEIKNFTGIDSPYEIPESPNLIVDTEKENVDQSVEKIYSAIKSKIK